MKKISIFIIFIFAFFISVTSVHAETCANINTEISNYQAINNKLSSYDCTKDTDSDIVKSCNKLNLQKSSIITKLYRLKEKNPKCTSENKKIDQIIQENSTNCTKISDGLLEDFSSKMLLVFYIFGPILVILFASLDYTKAIMSSNKEALRKTSINLVKRIVALLLIFLLPALVNIFTGISNSQYILNGDGYSCKADFVVLKSTYSIAYVPAEEEADTTMGGQGGEEGSSSNASTGASGNFLNWTQCNSPWSNKMLGGSSRSVCRSGCLVTSTAIQIANSGTAKNASSFNPGLFVDTLNSHGGFSGANFTWTGWQSVAPRFKLYNNRASISGSPAQKARQLANYINRGYYPVVEVKSCINGQHWVAIIGVKGTKVTMADPASSSTDLTHYACFARTGSQRVALYQVK